MGHETLDPNKKPRNTQKTRNKNDKKDFDLDFRIFRDFRG